MDNKDMSIVEFLDSRFGDNINNLKELNKIYTNAQEKKAELIKKLKIIQTEVPSKITAALAFTNQALNKVEDLELSKNSVNSEVVESLKNGAPMVERFQQSIKKISDIQQYISYVRWVMKIEETSGGIQQSILSDSMEDACKTFQELTKFHKLMFENSTKCFNLVEYLKKTIMFWYNILKDKLSKELDEIMKQIGWPFVSTPGPRTLTKSAVSPEKVVPSPFVVRDPALRLDDVIVNLLRIHLPSSINNEAFTSSTSESTSENVSLNDQQETIVADNTVLLPFQLLLRPLRKRFRFHFTGNKQTNNLNKPEWYLTQVINWVNHHAGFLEHTIQQVLDDNDYSHIDALMMFTKGLLLLVSTKLSVDIGDAMYSDELFTHTVDEVLLFDRELRVSYDISDSLLKTDGPLTVLARPDCIRKWLNVERTNAVDRLDALLSAEDAWRSHFSGTDADEVDDMKTPQCAESFITMLLTITDRYKNLPSSEDQLQFLDLQLLLLDDFRIRLTQVIRSLNTTQFDDVSIAILNAALYISTVLKEWADNVFFLELKYYKEKESDNPDMNPILPESLLKLGENNKSSTMASSQTTDETVFASMIDLYERIYTEGLESIAQDILGEFKEKSRPYLYDQWIALPPPEDQVVLVVSRSACPMLEVLQERLYSFEHKLCRSLFTKLWRYIADKVDLYLYEEVALKNHFNAGGASQLQFDMTRNLFPLFSPYSGKPENYFKRMKEVCQVLNLNKGNAMLLKEAISIDSTTYDPYDRIVPKTTPSKILSEVGVTLLKPDDVNRILNKRIDWKTN